MDNKIATEAEAYEIGRKDFVLENTRCCTKARALELGCNFDGVAEDNQLVILSGLSPKSHFIDLTLTGEEEWMTQKMVLKFAHPENLEKDDYQLYMINGIGYKSDGSETYIATSFTPFGKEVGSEDHPDEYTYVCTVRDGVNYIKIISIEPSTDTKGLPFEFINNTNTFVKYNVLNGIDGIYVVTNRPVLEDVTVTVNGSKTYTLNSGSDEVLLTDASLSDEVVLTGETTLYERDENFFIRCVYPYYDGNLGGSYKFIVRDKNSNIIWNQFASIQTSFPEDKISKDVYFYMPNKAEKSIWIGCLGSSEISKYRVQIDYYSTSYSFNGDCVQGDNYTNMVNVSLFGDPSMKGNSMIKFFKLN